MHKGLPLIALITSIVAVLVAGMGFISSDKQDEREAPEEALKEARMVLDKVISQRKKLRDEIIELRAQLDRVIEHNSGSAAIDTTQIEQAVEDAVKKSLDKHLNDFAVKVGAKGGDKLKGKPGNVSENFEKMLVDVSKLLNLEDKKKAAFNAVAKTLRTDLQNIQRSYRNNKTEREKRYDAVRKRYMGRIAQILTPAENKKFTDWLKNKTNKYPRLLFGIK